MGRLLAVLTLLLGLVGTAEAQKACKKGIPCGNTCISASKVCHVGTTGYHPRDERGRFIRSSSAKAQFMRQTGYPNGRPGYVVDHIIPLTCGGRDDPSNMQWQTVAEAKAKDRVERRGCAR